MFIKLGNVHINPEKITHFIEDGQALTVYFIGGEHIVLEGEEAKRFVAELSRGGRY